MVASTTYTVNLLVKSKDEASKALKGVATNADKAKKGMEGLAKAAKAATAVFAAAQFAKGAIQFLKLGANVQSTQHRFEAFAGGTQRAAEFLEAFNSATDGTVDRMSAMAGSSKMLQMGLVENADEMATMAAIATKLGDQTMSAGARIADFSALLANRSTPRLDNFGVASGKVRVRVEELKKAGYDLDQAFKLAVLEQGRISLKKLGDTSEQTATKIAQTEATLANFKTTLAATFATIASDSGALDWLNERLTGLPTTVGFLGNVFSAYGATVREVWGEHTTLKEALSEFDNQLKQQVATTALADSATEELRYGHTLLTSAVEESAGAVVSLVVSTDQSGASFAQYQAALDSTVAANDQAAMAVVRNREELERQTLATQSAAMAQMDLAAQLMGATEAQIAQAAIGQLKEALETGAIDFATYSTAVQETQLAFGLADEASINLSMGMTALTESLAAGTISAAQYDEQLALLVEKSQAESAQLEALGVLLPTVSEGMNAGAVATGGMQSSMDGLTSSTGASKGSVDALKGSIEALPSSKTITINIETRGSVPGMQHGGIARGGVTMVGERGPELVNLPPGARVSNHTQTRNVTNNFTNNISGGGGAAILAAQQRAATRASFAGTT